MSWRKNFYNKRSAKKLGWQPSWFGTTGFNTELITKIMAFQEDHDLKADGMCGDMTYRRKIATRQMLVLSDEEVDSVDNENFIYCDGFKKRIIWDKVKTSWLPDHCYKTYTKYRKPTMVVTHWDAALSASSCKRILEKKKISTHFVIDNDGTILQLVDTNHAAWHAGIRKVNNASIGIDFSNAVYLKYNLTYQRRGHGLRPIIEDWRVHGRKIKPFLGYYPVQIEAYKALLTALHEHYDIKLECPLTENGNLVQGVDSAARGGKFEGIVNHYNLTTKKWDCSGLQLDEILKEIT